MLGGSRAFGRWRGLRYVPRDRWDFLQTYSQRYAALVILVHKTV
jgi:hypothetical protein